MQDRFWLKRHYIFDLSFLLLRVYFYTQSELLTVQKVLGERLTAQKSKILLQTDLDTVIG